MIIIEEYDDDCFFRYDYDTYRLNWVPSLNRMVCYDVDYDIEYSSWVKIRCWYFWIEVYYLRVQKLVQHEYDVMSDAADVRSVDDVNYF